MFVELMPLLGERTVMITVSRVNQNSIRVNFQDSEQLALSLTLRHRVRLRVLLWCSEMQKENRINGLGA